LINKTIQSFNNYNEQPADDAVDFEFLQVNLEQPTVARLQRVSYKEHARFRITSVSVATETTTCDGENSYYDDGADKNRR